VARDRQTDKQTDDNASWEGCIKTLRQNQLSNRRLMLSTVNKLAGACCLVEPLRLLPLQPTLIFDDGIFCHFTNFFFQNIQI